jgi:hypothetical protein
MMKANTAGLGTRAVLAQSPSHRYITPGDTTTEQFCLLYEVTRSTNWLPW